ncbi:hypothetical protein [Pseudoflavitalea rhizosphaerae]|uniref:hypothetical protein n=1 Tax=Pseudoflavitalea rhizosphaerae TaxID=1884793 RepID=UPI000F8F05FF|nr:hypothetical protein [Pseudoflavitalea rhizosphaerae]
MKRKEFLSNQPDPDLSFDRNDEFEANKNTVWDGKGLDAIIYDSAKILKEKGYDEKGLNNGEPEGMFKSHLKAQLQHLLESDETIIGVHQFQVQNFGFYNNGDDIVRFTFSYDFEDQKITLKEVEAEFKGVPINQTIDRLSDIWTSQDMYRRVKELWIIVHDENLTILEGNVNDVIQNESGRLRHLGYEQNGQLNRKLQAEIFKSMEKESPTNHFSLKATRFCPQGEMKVTLYYEYIQDIFQLKLKSIRADLNNRKVEYSNDGTSPIPSLNDLKSFFVKQKNDLANKLINHKPDTSFKNRLK